MEAYRALRPVEAVNPAEMSLKRQMWSSAGSVPVFLGGKLQAKIPAGANYDNLVPWMSINRNIDCR
jgi:hypothetical protein